jgi:hypothetical protein
VASAAASTTALDWGTLTVLCGILDWGSPWGHCCENLHVRRGKVRLELPDELVKLALLRVRLLKAPHAAPVVATLIDV